MSSNLKFKFISIFLSFIIATTPAIVWADTPPTPAPEVTALGRGKVRAINRGQHAPYSGILLDNIAAAKAIVDSRYSQLRFDLRLEFELKKLQTEYELKLGNLQTRFDSANLRNESLLQIKNDEIGRLQEIIKDRPGNNSHWWAVGGFVVGALVSLGIFYAATEASK